MNFLVIVLFIAIGYFAKKFSMVDAKKAHWLSQYVIYICLPAIVLLRLPTLTLDVNLIIPAMAPWVLIPILWLITHQICSAMQWSRNIEGCLLLIVCFGNTSFVGFPIIQSLFGEHALAYAVVYDQLGSFLSLAVVGNLILARYGEDQNQATSQTATANLGSVVKRVITFPPFIAILVSFAFRVYPLSEDINYFLEILSKTLIPSTMFLVGHHLVFNLPVVKRKPLVLGLSIKMLLMPLVAFVILIALDQQGLFAKVTLLETAMPPMVTASILAIHGRLAPKLAAAAVGYGLIAAVLTLPMFYQLSLWI